MKGKKIFHSNEIEEIIYVDLQVDELQMYFFKSTSPQVFFSLINITSKLEYCRSIESPKFWLCSSSAVNYFKLFLNKAAATEIISAQAWQSQKEKVPSTDLFLLFPKTESHEKYALKSCHCVADWKRNSGPVQNSEH